MTDEVSNKYEDMDGNIGLEIAKTNTSASSFNILTYKHQRSIVEQQWSCKLSKIQKYFTGSY
jgi:hypothetical protein